jgi:hypothetical protein
LQSTECRQVQSTADVAAMIIHPQVPVRSSTVVPAALSITDWMPFIVPGHHDPGEPAVKPVSDGSPDG